MKTYRYVTVYTDIRVYGKACQLVHFASSLPQAIKEGRAYVRGLNHDDMLRSGFKFHRFGFTYRSR